MACVSPFAVEECLSQAWCGGYTFKKSKWRGPVLYSEHPYEKCLDATSAEIRHLHLAYGDVHPMSLALDKEDHHASLSFLDRRRKVGEQFISAGALEWVDDSGRAAVWGIHNIWATER